MSRPPKMVTLRCKWCKGLFHMKAYVAKTEHRRFCNVPCRIAWQQKTIADFVPIVRDLHACGLSPTQIAKRLGMSPTRVAQKIRAAVRNKMLERRPQKPHVSEKDLPPIWCSHDDRTDVKYKEKKPWPAGLRFEDAPIIRPLETRCRNTRETRSWSSMGWAA